MPIFRTHELKPAKHCLTQTNTVKECNVYFNMFAIYLEIMNHTLLQK